MDGTRSFAVLIGITKLVAPQPRATFPAWQGMQYMRNRFTGYAKLAPSTTPAMPTSTGPPSTTSLFGLRTGNACECARQKAPA